MDSNNRRRMSDGASGAMQAPASNRPGPTPVMQVVGFHVEGASPSPVMGSLLAGTAVVGAGSPTPVIIPPSFQVQQPSGGLQRDTSMPRPAAAGNDGAQPSVGSGSTQQARGNAAEGAAAPVAAPVPLPPPSQPKPIANPERAEAAHVGLPRPDSINSDLSGMSGISSEHQVKQSLPAPSTSAAHGHASATAAAPKAPPSAAHQGGGSAEKKSQKEMTKAERRALQEAQRAAKAAAKGGDAGPPTGPPAGADGKKGGGGDARGGSAGGAGAKLDSKGSLKERAAAADKAQPSPALSRQATEGGVGHTSLLQPQSSDTSAAAAAKPKKQQGAKVVSLNSTELFAHLQQFKKVDVSTLLGHKDARFIHPAVLQLGLRYADGSVSGASARCVAMLHTFCEVIQDYTTPEGKSLARDLTQHLNSIIAFLVECRPLSVSMGNAIKLLKLRISQIDPATPEAEAKEQLIADIQEYISTRILAADKELARTAMQKVDAGDVILVFAFSHIVSRVLILAAEAGKRFRVVVMDARPELEGRKMLAVLQAAGIACSYAHLNSVSFVIRDVTKVFLGAAAVMSNGTVMGRAGTASVAMVAHAHSKPVMICCESFKFHERVQLDSITHNELGDPDKLVEVPGHPDINQLQGWQTSPRLGLLNLKYDAMPAEYVTMVVTEFGMIPPTSVPVILREYQQFGREMGR